MAKATIELPGTTTPTPAAAETTKVDARLAAFTAIATALQPLESRANRYAVLSAAAQFHGFSLKLPE